MDGRWEGEREDEWGGDSVQGVGVDLVEGRTRDSG